MVHDSSREVELKPFDSDACDKDEINSTFSHEYQHIEGTKRDVHQAYVLHIDGTREASCSLAVAKSNHVCEIYQFIDNNLISTDAIKDSDSIIGVQFSPEDYSLLYGAFEGGVIKLWDLRMPEKVVSEFVDTSITDGKKRKFSCFEVSPNNRLVTAGTELYEGEVFILFWDLRNVKILGGYWESHTNTVTQLKIDPNDTNRLVSGSLDGLINIYDINKTNEDDALLDTLNTESSVEQIVLYNYKGKDSICCVTPTSDIQLWKTEEAAPYANFNRLDIMNAIKRKSEAHCYVIGAHPSSSEVVVLAGSSSRDECLRAVGTDNKNLVPMSSLKENKQRVRCSWYNHHHETLVTGGEKGIIDIWKVAF